MQFLSHNLHLLYQCLPHDATQSAVMPQ